MSEDQKTASEAAVTAAQSKADETNKGRTGKGTRVRVGQTRGRNPQVVSWEAFDEALTETLPTTLTEFMDVSKTQDEKLIVAYLIDGFNSAQYTAASDPVAEYIDASWPDDIQKNFRMAVRNYSTATGLSIEEAVTLIKPGIEKAVAAKKAVAAVTEPATTEPSKA